MRIKAAFVAVLISVAMLWGLSMPTQAYNSPGGDAPEITGGHPWITNQAIDYLKRVDPFAYAVANRYRQQLVYGSWYADHNSGRCNLGIPVFTIVPPSVFLVPISHSINCDSTNHYDPTFHFAISIPVFLIFSEDFGFEGTVNASVYAANQYQAAVRCLPFLNAPEGSLPAECAVPDWRRINPININALGALGIIDTPDFNDDGPLVPYPGPVLLGWALHMIQDLTQVYHTRNQGLFGHEGFENYVDAFIRDPNTNANQLPDDTSGAPIEVESAFAVNPFIQGLSYASSIAAETRAISRTVEIEVAGINILCCDSDKVNTDAFAKASLNRAIVYSAKLIRYYLRAQTKQLSSAVLTTVIEN